MNNKGFAISSVMYSILVVFLIILVGILGTLGSRKVVLDKLKKDLKEELESGTSDNVWDFTYTGNYQEFVIPSSGEYKIELWGASDTENNKNGSYTSGVINFNQSKNLFIYIGQEKKNGTYNKGNTDLRIVGGGVNDFNSKKSSIMTAKGYEDINSYISGHVGCVALEEDSTSNNVITKTGVSGLPCTYGTDDVTCSYHYSEYIFRDTLLVDDIDQVQPDGSRTNGHVGDGYARITKIR